MGCAHGLLERRDTLDGVTWPSASLHPRETRILQSDVVDTCLEASHPPSEPDDDLDVHWEASLSHVAVPTLSPFEDPGFDAVPDSLGHTASCMEATAGVEWRRPRELCAHACFFASHVDGNDLMRGELGDGHFLAACAVIARHAQLVEKVVPPGQVLSGASYHGQARFRFHRFGQWTQVTVDDRLPVLRGRLAFAHCADPSVFWVALLEKAYAKLHGSYESMGQGDPLEAIMDLTGGLVERLRAQSLDLAQLSAALEQGALVSCARSDLKGEGRGTGHAHSVTACLEGTVCVRSHWGNGEQDDADVWMAFNEFRDAFHEVFVVTLEQPDRTLVTEGRWILGVNAGGCRNDVESFARNPQYLLTVSSTGEEQEDDTEDCMVVIGLMQEHGRRRRNQAPRLLPIAFFVYKWDDVSLDGRLSAEYLLCVSELGGSGTFRDSRQVLCRLALAPSAYVVIPATFHPGQVSAFLLRVWTTRKATLRTLPDVQDTPGTP